MENRMVDLHVHSTESDGTLSPQEVMLAAKEAGLAAVALTDHDTVSGIAKAAPVAHELGLELVPGIELSTEYRSPFGNRVGKEIHIVGLYLDTKNKELLEKTEEFRECRNNRNAQMVAALQAEGFDITMEALAAQNPNCVITRANIARFLYEHGYIKTMQEAFSKYIGDGCRCYVRRFQITPMEAVSLIHSWGGISVLAHPMLYRMSSVHLQHMIDELKDAGLDGIEALYSTHTPGEEKLVKKIAAQNGLLISGGSDFHGANKASIRIGRGLGSLSIPYSILSEIQKRRAIK
ncbi:MAG: PHP domain-containing protein [Roseburia sp.]